MQPAITALTATFSTVSSQNSRKAVGRMPADHLVRRMAGALEHRGDALFRRQDDREVVGPVVLEEQLLEIVFGVGRDQARRRALEGQTLQVFLIERLGQPLDHFLHEALLGDRVDALDIAAQLVRRFVDDGLRHIDLPRARHAGGARGRGGEPRKDMGMDGDRRNASLLQGHRQPHDRGATGASKSDTQDGRVGIRLYFRAHVRVVDPAFARLDHAACRRRADARRTSAASDP